MSRVELPDAAASGPCVALCFARYGDHLHIWGSPTGTLASLRPLGSYAPAWEDVRVAADAIQATIERACRDGEVTNAALADVCQHGMYLFDELLPGPARAWLRAEGPGTLTLVLDDDLLFVPWELLHTSRSFVAEQWATGRIIARDIDNLDARTCDHTRPLLLGVIADPDGQLHEAYAEGVDLRALGERRDTVDVELRAADVDATSVRRHARLWDVLHYAGHIDADGWRMSDSVLRPQDVERMAGGAPLPALVFAHGCAGGDARAETVTRAWLDAGTAHVIGSQFVVPDRLGPKIARAFYTHALEGVPLGESLRRARHDTADAFGPGVWPWGSYVLYGDPHARIRPAPHTSPARSAPADPPLARSVADRGTRLARSSEGRATEMTRSVAPADAIYGAGPMPGIDVAYLAVLVLISLLTAAVVVLQDPDLRPETLQDRSSAEMR